MLARETDLNLAILCMWVKQTARAFGGVWENGEPYTNLVRARLIQRLFLTDPVAMITSRLCTGIVLSKCTMLMVVLLIWRHRKRLAVLRKVTASLLAIVTVATLVLSGCSSKADTWGTGNNSAQQNALQGSSTLKGKEGTQGTQGTQSNPDEEAKLPENSSQGSSQGSSQSNSQGTTTNPSTTSPSSANNATYENDIVVIHYPNSWVKTNEGAAIAITSPDEDYIIAIIEYPDTVIDEDAFDSFCPAIYGGFESNGWTYPSGHERLTINNTIIEKTYYEVDNSDGTITGYLLICAGPKGFCVITCMAYDDSSSGSASTFDSIINDMEYK